MSNCYRCDGNGLVDCPNCNGHGKDPAGSSCAHCDGNGDIGCINCSGTGALGD